MNVSFRNILVWLAILSLAIEIPILQIGGSGVKIWILAAILGGFVLFWNIYRKKSLSLLKKSKIFWLGIGFTLFSALGIINSPLKSYSIKQLAVLILLIVLGIFFETNFKTHQKQISAALAWGLFLSSIAAIYQNVAFEYGWPHFEAMAARPNAFFPEPDWLGLFLVLGLVPFLVWVGIKREKSRLPKILINKYLFYSFLVVNTIAIILTVARASWLALFAEMGVILILLLYKLGIGHWTLDTQKSSQYSVPSSQLFKTVTAFISLIIFSLIIINIFHLTRFNIPDRFRSIILREHIVTLAQNPATGEKFKINLEEVNYYKNLGYSIQEEYTRDENVASREEKVASTWDIIRQHPVWGSGLGVTLIATNYQHNANNLFLEWWASAGLGGLFLIIGLLVYLLSKGTALIKKDFSKAQIILAGTVGFIIVNLFNASIFLAFAWFFLAFLLSNVVLTNHKKV